MSNAVDNIVENSDVVDVDGSSMSIIDHLHELRHRFIISLVAFGLGFGFCYIFAADIYAFLVEPLAGVYSEESQRRMIYTGLTEAFFTYIRLAFFGGFILAFPVIATQLYLFVSPGLYKKEKRVVAPFLVAAPVLFMLGAGLVYYFVFPLAWQFFAGFETTQTSGGLPIVLEAKVSEYLSLVMSLIIAFGLAFQLPVLLMLLARFGFVTSGGLKKRRKYALLAIFVAAAIMTPPDVVSQICLAVPLLMLYEGSILGCRYMEKSKNA